MTVPLSSQVVATPKPSSRMIGDGEIPTHDTIGDDERDVNQNDTLIDDEDVHMRGSQNAINLEYLDVDTQASRAVGDIFLVDTYGI